MNIADLMNKLPLALLAGDEALNKEITGGYCGDLLSDVMGNASEGMVWITMQAHKNVVAVASLKEISAIILVNSAQPDNDTIDHARAENIAILVTPLSAFEISGRIYTLLYEDLQA